MTAKEKAKELGAKWDATAKLWYASSLSNKDLIAQYSPVRFAPSIYNKNGLGAIDKQTGSYVSPCDADKAKVYHCPTCEKVVIPKQGHVNRHHFAHLSSDDPCTYYSSHPGESELHKQAKRVLQQKGSANQLSVVRQCSYCENSRKLALPSTGNWVLEHRFSFEGAPRVADVAVLGESGPSFLLEVVNTHRTKETSRPEPWVELSADEILSNANLLHCLRFTCTRPRCVQFNENKVPSTTKRRRYESSDDEDWGPPKPWRRSCNCSTILRKRDNEVCKGDGSCLEQCGHEDLFRSDCCQPVPCSYCGMPMPQWVLDCHRGRCINCDVWVYSQELDDKQKKEAVDKVKKLWTTK